MILLAIIILWILFKLWLNGSDVFKDNNKNKNKNNLKDDYIKKDIYDSSSFEEEELEIQLKLLYFQKVQILEY